MEKSKDKEINLWMENELKKFTKNLQKSMSEQEVVECQLALRSTTNYLKNFIEEKHPNINRNKLEQDEITQILIETVNEIAELSMNINKNSKEIIKLRNIQAFKIILNNSNMIREKLKYLEEDKELTAASQIEIEVNKVLQKNYKFIKKMESVIQNFTQINEILTQYIKGDNNKKKRIENKYPELFRGENSKYINFIGGTMEERLIRYSNEISEKTIEKYDTTIKQNEIDCLKGIYKVLNRTNAIQIYNQRHKNNLYKTTKAQLEYDFETDADNIGIKDFFSNTNLSKENITNINSYNIFWSNKYAKEMENIQFGLFYLCQFNFLENAVKGEKFEISNERVKLIKRQVDLLKRIYVKLMKQAKEGRNPNIEAERLDKIYGIKYTDKIYINSQRNSKLKDDNNLSVITNSAIYGAYEIKTELLNRKIIDCINSKENVNFGMNLDATTSTMLCIAIDEKGLNMPLIVHLPVNKLKEALKERGMDEKLQIYLRDEDFKTIDNKSIPINILMPINMSKIEKIKARLKQLVEEKRDNCKEYKFLEHILANQYPKKKPRSLRHAKDTRKVDLNNMKTELEELRNKEDSLDHIVFT